MKLSSRDIFADLPKNLLKKKMEELGYLNVNEGQGSNIEWIFDFNDSMQMFVSFTDMGYNENPRYVVRSTFSVKSDNGNEHDGEWFELIADINGNHYDPESGVAEISYPNGYEEDFRLDRDQKNWVNMFLDLPEIVNSAKEVEMYFKSKGLDRYLKKTDNKYTIL